MVERNSTIDRSHHLQFVTIAIAVIATIITIKAVSVMMFASLGSTSTGRVSYVLVLQIVLAAIGISSYLSNSVNLNSKPKVLKQSCLFLSITLCGALLGFYYGGSYADNDPQYAIFGAIALGIIFNLVAVFQARLVATIISFIASMCAYGFASMTGIRGINLLAASLFIPGIIWSCVSLIYIGLSVANLLTGISKINRSS